MAVPATACPKCGFRQTGGEECLRCGIIFSRYRADGRFAPAAAALEFEDESPSQRMGMLRRFYRVFRWAALAVLIIVLVLIFRPSLPPAVSTNPEAIRRAEDKVRVFQSAMHRGRPGKLEMDQEELNGWLDTNLAIQRAESNTPASSAAAGESAISLAKRALAGQVDGEPTIEKVQSSVRDIKIELRGDLLHAYVVFNLYGMDLSLDLEGHLTASEGHLRLEPTAGKLGSLPLMAGTLQGAAYRLFDSPQNREKFRLPIQIREVSVEGGRLIMSAR